MPDEKRKLKPFHETIVDAIGRCQKTDEIFRLFYLIEDTKIPRNHDAIIAAIDMFFDFPGSAKYATIIRKIKESILAQKPIILTTKEKAEKKMLRIYVRTYGPEIGQQLAKDIKDAGDDLTLQHKALKKAEKALNRPFKADTNYRINSSNPRKVKS